MGKKTNNNNAAMGRPEAALVGRLKCKVDNVVFRPAFPTKNGVMSLLLFLFLFLAFLFIFIPFFLFSLPSVVASTGSPSRHLNHLFWCLAGEWPPKWQPRVAEQPAD
ncbi:hypothetical protein LY78DRAFT_70340 [Colletotrichum sublineola]|nr:hypothetical protein LY78DRAFT_70340 [Colletotrichum sublineola]